MVEQYDKKSKIDRIAWVLKSISNSEDGITIPELAQRIFSVSEKTITRDVQVLFKEGYIFTDNENTRPKIWRAKPETDRQVSNIIRANQSLTMAAVGEITDWLPPSAANFLKRLASEAKQDLVKAAKSNPDRSEDAKLATWLNRFKFLPPVFVLQSPNTESQTVNHIKEAVYQQRQISISYVNRDGRSLEIRNFHPLAYLYVGHTGYVIGYDNEKGPNTIKLYAAQRFKEAAMLDTRYPVSVPHGFTLENFLATSKDASFIGGIPKRVRLKVWGWLVTILKESKLSDDMKMQLVGEDVAIVSATIATSWQFCHWILSCAEVIEVLEPQDLREHIKNRIKAAADRYSS